MKMFEQTQWVWVDGSMVRWREATVHVSAHALHYGTGVFEGIRCYETAQGPAIFRLDAHLDRFYMSAETYGMRIPFSRRDLTEAIYDVVRSNGFRSCYIRPICYRGSHDLGLLPDRCPVHASVIAWPWATYHGGNSREEGVRVEISRWRKFHSTMMPTTAKACGQYLNSILALRDANGGGYDESLLLNVDGTISEGSGENIFTVKNGAIATNDGEHSILMGVTRDSIITIARNLGLQVHVRAIELRDLVEADEAFFTGTAVEVTPIREINHAAIGTGKPGPVTRALQQAFFEIVKGRNRSYGNWLQLVPNGPACRSGEDAAGHQGSEAR